MFRFFHEKFDVYRVSLEFVQEVDAIESRWFAKHADRRSQLSRAADSIPLNVAEGLGQRTLGLRRKHLQIAMASAGECQAVLEILRIKGAPTDSAEQLVRRVGDMIDGMLG